MQALASLLSAAQGYRTYAAGIAAFLVAIAGVFGIVPDATSQKLSVACVALGVVFSRMAQADHALTLADVQTDIADIVMVVHGLQAPSPTVPPSAPSAAALGLFQPPSDQSTQSKVA